MLTDAVQLGKSFVEQVAQHRTEAARRSAPMIRPGQAERPAPRYELRAAERRLRP